MVEQWTRVFNSVNISHQHCLYANRNQIKVWTVDFQNGFNNLLIKTVFS